MLSAAVFRITWPVVGLSTLLAAACLASMGYFGRLQSELGESLRRNSGRLQAAQQVQIHLREYRVHTVILAAGPSDDRRRLVEEDRQKFRAALSELREMADQPDDVADLDQVEAGWARYDDELGRDTSRRAFQSVEELATWADAHRVRALLVPCNRLVDRAEGQMAITSARSEDQTRWAGRGLLAVGLIGPLAGLFAGYGIARGLTQRMTRLSARVHQQERELLRAEQLAVVGQLAAGVAHEVRNPLTGIKMLVEAAVRPTALVPLTHADLELIRDEIGRLERTTQGLLDYAKPLVPIRRPHDIREVITRAAEVVAVRAGRSGVTVDVETGEHPLTARIDADHFVSLMTNLLINALDATPTGGRVRVEGGMTADGHIRLTVTDSGPGIQAELKDALFTPFATTKPTGTGLGLAVARRIAVDHGGTLVADNAAGGGAVFTATIPAAEATDAETPGR